MYCNKAALKKINKILTKKNSQFYKTKSGGNLIKKEIKFFITYHCNCGPRKSLKINSIKFSNNI